MKKLFLLRHAKTEPGSMGRPDNERRLTERGIRDSRALGSYFDGAENFPELVLCSTAVRTVETLMHMLQMQSAADAFKTEFLKDLYLPSPDKILGALAMTSDSVGSVLLISHNPGLGELARDLAGDYTDLSLDEYPTAALTEFSCDVPGWSLITPSVTRLETVFVPKLALAL